MRVAREPREERKEGKKGHAQEQSETERAKQKEDRVPSLGCPSGRTRRAHRGHSPSVWSVCLGWHRSVEGCSRWTDGQMDICMDGWMDGCTHCHPQGHSSCSWIRLFSRARKRRHLSSPLHAQNGLACLLRDTFARKANLFPPKTGGRQGSYRPKRLKQEHRCYCCQVPGYSLIQT